MCDIDTVIDKVKKIGAIINAPEYLLVVHTSPIGDGTPHIEIRGGELFYVSSERGYEFSRKRVNNLDQLLYFFFDRVTTRIASDYELENRIPGRDCRRIIFAKKLELLEKINSNWEVLKKKEIEDILVNAPYDDAASDRAEYCRELRKKGIKENEIDKLSYKKYPLPSINSKNKVEL